MTSPSFDVLTEPWISVIRLDGVSDELGIVSCLEQAHNLREIRDPAPIIEFGMYRLLVAFVLDALIMADRRPEDAIDLKELINEGGFATSMIEGYVKQCGDVFDLFHPERPFLQMKMNKSKPKPLAAMFPAVPSGTNVSLWHHETDSNMQVSAQKAARLVTTISPFMTSGGAGLSPSINGAPAIYALPVGKSLFETIVLNIPCRKSQDSGNGTTAWRSTLTPGQERSQATTVESLTWRPRQMQLVPEVGNDDNIIVREMKFEKGDSTRLTWIDANLAYRHGKDKTAPVRMRENRPLWRDAGPLLLLNEGKHGQNDKKISFTRPDVINAAFEVKEINDPLVIQVYGMRTDMKMKVFEWVKSFWAVPSKLGRSTRLGDLVQQELARSEQAADHLRSCIKALYPRGGSGNKNALRTIVARCERTYWQHLESSFHPLMEAFATLNPDAPDDPELLAVIARDWRDAISITTQQQFEICAEDMDADSDALERQVRARSRLNNKLKEVLS